MTPAEWLVDREGRPYFLWDVNMTLDEFRSRLASGADRDYWLAVLLRQAKPDDVYQFVGLEEIREAWPRIDRGLGKQRAFWQWRLARWERDGK